jgi:mannosyl-oligosaccharide alpha-1,2-mannosidase
MWPRVLNFQSQDAGVDHIFTLGALADSLYEYLPKMALLVGGGDGGRRYEKMYRRAAEVIIDRLLFRPMIPNKWEDILFLGTVRVLDDKGDVRLEAESEHLACFAGGMFALAGKMLDIPRHVEVGDQLARGCAWAYDAFPAGLMPEIFGMVACDEVSNHGCEFDQELWARRKRNQRMDPGFVHARDSRYLLRPEAIESLFILYRITGREELRDKAWKMFRSIESWTRTQYAYSAIECVTDEEQSRKLDSMEVSFVGPPPHSQKANVDRG